VGDSIMDCRDGDTNSAKIVQTGGLLLFSFIFVLLIYPAIAFAAEKPDYSVFDYIIGFVGMDIILSIMLYLIKK
jgi:hypothetical protein